MFTVIEDAWVILFTRGVYRQAKVYGRGSNVYGAFGSGFIRLRKNNSTSVPNIRWIEIEGAEPN